MGSWHHLIMKKTSKTVIFFGNERLATAVTTTAPVLRALIDAGYQIEAVITSHQNPVSHQKRDLEIGAVAQEHGIPVILLGQSIPLIKKVQKHQADTAVLVAFGKIIPQSVIELFPNGIINLHPSLLPQLRGSTPIESAILQGLTRTGVSIMKISSEMDAGPIFAQQEVSLTGTETKFELAAKLNEIGSKLLVTHLPEIIDGTLHAQEQNNSAATYTPRISKEDGIIDWHKTAQQLEREVRAYLGWPGSRTTLGTIDVTITQASVAQLRSVAEPGTLRAEKQEFFVATSQGWLAIQRLKPAGKAEMDSASFLAGYRDRL